MSTRSRRCEETRVTTREENIIKLQYRLGVDSQCTTSDRDLLDRPIKEVLKYTIRDQKYWVATLKASRKYKKDSDTNMYENMRQVMRRWAFVPD